MEYQIDPTGSSPNPSPNQQELLDLSILTWQENL